MNSQSIRSHIAGLEEALAIVRDGYVGVNALRLKQDLIETIELRLSALRCDLQTAARKEKAKCLSNSLTEAGSVPTSSGSSDLISAIWSRG